MGQLLTTIKLTNLATIGITHKSIEIEALVDTGAAVLCITEDQAVALGLEYQDAERRDITLSKDRTDYGFYIPHIQLNYGGLDLMVNAYVVTGSNQALFGAVPLAELNLVLDLAQQKLEPRIWVAKFMQPKTRLVIES